MRLMAAVIVIGVAAMAGCSTLEPPAEVAGGVTMELRRGSSWRTLTVKPPFVRGYTAMLRLKDGALRGRLGAARLDLELRDGSIESRDRSPIEVEILDEGHGLILEGRWLGRPIRLHVGELGVRGSLWTLGGGFCDFQLNEISPDGVLEGFSSCGGMPEETLVEVPPVLEKWLTRTEVVSLVLALLSSAPRTEREKVWLRGPWL